MIPIYLGTYGKVYRCLDETTNTVVALKKLKYHDNDSDFPITSKREIAALKRCSLCPYCVQLLDICCGINKQDIFLVFEYCEHDIETLVHSFNYPFKELEIKTLLLQLLSALSFLHESRIIHRDIKLSNLLYTKAGILKLADFGLSRQIPEDAMMTPKVTSLWYRAPEILLGATRYSTAIDLWATGCVLGELLFHRPLLSGNTELQQIDSIFDTLGCPTARIWPELTSLPLVHTGAVDLAAAARRNIYNNVRVLLPTLGDAGFQLLNRLLAYDPARRLTASEALDHEYFATSPFPADSQLMPTFPATLNGIPMTHLPYTVAVSGATASTSSTAVEHGNGTAAVGGSHPVHAGAPPPLAATLADSYGFVRHDHKHKQKSKHKHNNSSSARHSSHHSHRKHK